MYITTAHRGNILIEYKCVDVNAPKFSNALTRVDGTLRASLREHPLNITGNAVTKSIVYIPSNRMVKYYSELNQSLPWMRVWVWICK